MQGLKISNLEYWLNKRKISFYFEYYSFLKKLSTISELLAVSFKYWWDKLLVGEQK